MRESGAQCLVLHYPGNMLKPSTSFTCKKTIHLYWLLFQTVTRM